jgi:hypothetical protein
MGLRPEIFRLQYIVFCIIMQWHGRFILSVHKYVETETVLSHNTFTKQIHQFDIYSSK